MLPTYIFYIDGVRYSTLYFSSDKRAKKYASDLSNEVEYKTITIRRIRPGETWFKVIFTLNDFTK